MSRNRFGAKSEQSNQFSSTAKRSPPAGVHSPRRGLINGPISNHLHRTPVAVAVSANGERTICPVDAVSNPLNINCTNPFANEHKETTTFLESTSDEAVQKLPSKRQRAHLQKRRKIQEKERRRTAKIILTQRNSARPRPPTIQKNVSVQTDPQITGVYRPTENIGDPGDPSSQCYDVTLTPKLIRKSICAVSDLGCGSKKKAGGIDNFFAKFMPESLKILTSFMIMIILIFWLTSIILDVEVPSDFFRMATNYVRSFKWGYYRKQPQTNAEKCLEYLMNFFK